MKAKSYKQLAHEKAREAGSPLKLETLHDALLRDVEAIEQKLISMVQATQIQRSDFIELCVRLDAMKQGLVGPKPGPSEESRR